jgi:acyl-CoA thioesterase-1
MRRYLLAVLAAILALLVGAASPLWAAPVHIAAFGDSNTAAFLVGEADGYPADLEKILKAKGYDVVITNGGVNGATSGDGVESVDRLVPAGSDIAIVFFGRNDYRHHVDETVTRANMDKIVARLTQRHIAVLLCGYWQYDFSAIAEKYRAAYYPEFFAGVSANRDKLPQYTMRLDPWHHLTAEGYRIVAANIAPAVEALVTKVAAAREKPQSAPVAASAN